MPAALVERNWAQILSDGAMECAECGEVKSLDQMRKRPSLKDGTPRFGPNCNVCNTASARRWFHNNRERATEQRFRNALKHNYGMTLEEYEELLSTQAGACAICGGVNPEHSRHGTQFRLSVDHNHDTGEVRGLLCNNCNRAIGLLDDDAALLRRAITYLEREEP